MLFLCLFLRCFWIENYSVVVGCLACWDSCSFFHLFIIVGALVSVASSNLAWILLFGLYVYQILLLVVCGQLVNLLLGLPRELLILLGFEVTSALIYLFLRMDESQLTGIWLFLRIPCTWCHLRMKCQPSVSIFIEWQLVIRLLVLRWHVLLGMMLMCLIHGVYACFTAEALSAETWLPWDVTDHLHHLLGVWILKEWVVWVHILLLLFLALMTFLQLLHDIRLFQLQHLHHLLQLTDIDILLIQLLLGFLNLLLLFLQEYLFDIQDLFLGAELLLQTLIGPLMFLQLLDLFLECFLFPFQFFNSIFNTFNM